MNEGAEEQNGQHGKHGKHGKHAPLTIGAALRTDVLEPMKRAFVGKDEVIDLLGVALVAGENLFLLGPPGTAKSALVHDLARRLHGDVFDYLLTRFTEPSELFGPFDIRRLREGDLVTNTAGMLPEASLVFLDELLNANSAILNSLLMVLNERVFRRGRETRKLPVLSVIGASNRLPEDDALGALFDRFLLRVVCDNVPPESLTATLAAGWQLERDSRKPADATAAAPVAESEAAADAPAADAPADDAPAAPGGQGGGSPLTIAQVRALSALVADVDLEPLAVSYPQLIQRLRTAGVALSDRRAVKLQRVIAASALLSGRLRAQRSDLWVMRYVWDTQEQQSVLATIVGELLEQLSDTELAEAHPRTAAGGLPDPEQLNQSLEQIAVQLAEPAEGTARRGYLKDQLTLLSGRCQWVADQQQRDFLEQRIQDLWTQMGED